MKSIEFIRELSKTVPGFIAGSYALAQILGTPFVDIDYFVDAENLKSVILDDEGHVNATINLNGVSFKRCGMYKDLNGFAAYQSVGGLEPAVNIIAVKRLSMAATLANFDLDILRVAMTGDFSKVDVIDQDHVRAVQRKLVGVARRTLTNSPITYVRLNKYKSRLPEYEFVTYL